MADRMCIKDVLSIAPDARPMMRWWWVGPAMTCDEVTRQLTLMRDGGIGGVEVAYVFPVCLEGEIEGVTNHRFVSPAFCEVLRFAAAEAQRLGMRFDLTLGSGWPFGGPHISVKHAARMLETHSFEIPPDKVDVPLPDLDESATILTVVDENGRAIPTFNGRLRLDNPSPTSLQATVLMSTPTGQWVKRAAVGAEGLVLDHYSNAALKIHLDAVGQQLLDATGDGRVYAVFTDSLEVYHSNWTEEFKTEFRRRRGYDLDEFLPMLVNAMHRGKDSDEVEDPQKERLIRDIQHDYALTLPELLHDKFLAPLQQFAHANNVLSRVQAYGVPPATLSSYRYVDLAEGETTHSFLDLQIPAEWTEITPIRIASSAGHFKKHNVVSGETWTRLHSPPYAATPLDMKAEADQFFLAGVNQIIGHGWCHRPAGKDPSQWVFYAAGNFNETNPWYPVLGDVAQYLQTVSSLLRAGDPAVDVGIYLPDHDVWSKQTLSSNQGNVHHVYALRRHIGLTLPAELLRHGFNFDLVDDAVLQMLAQSQVPRYRLIILPNIERIPLATLEALQHLAGQSVKIITLGRVPDQPPGHVERTRDEQAIQRLSSAMFGKDLKRGIHHLAEVDVATLKEWCVPDVDLDQSSPKVGYVHRHLSDGELYFFVNTTNEHIRLNPRFRDPQQHVYRLDPITRKACLATSMEYELQAYESIVYLLSSRKLDLEDFSDFIFSEQTKNESLDEKDISEGWELALAQQEAKQLDRLVPWTEWPEVREYAGAGVYRRGFHAPSEWIDQTVYLEFDLPKAIVPHRSNPDRRNTGYRTFIDAPIKDAAEVFLNGDRVAALFAPPYRIELTGRLITGDNVLEIKVYNRLINALAGKPLYDFSRVHQTYGQRFDVIQDFDSLKIEPAGLKGNVRLRVLGIKRGQEPFNDISLVPRITEHKDPCHARKGS